MEQFHDLDPVRASGMADGYGLRRGQALSRHVSMKDAGQSGPQPGRSLSLITQAGLVPEGLHGSVMLLGNFDGFHRGHQALLDAATRLAGSRPVGAMSVEPHPRKLFAPQSDPFRLTTVASKLETFSRFGLAFVYSPSFDRRFASQGPEQFVEDILVEGFGVSHVIVGQGFRFGARRRGDVPLLHRMGQTQGFSVTAVDEIEWGDVRCSSTLIRDLLLAGNVEDANALLGYAWSVEVGLPAAALWQSSGLAIAWPSDLLLPGAGTYDVSVRRLGATTSRLSGRLVIASRQHVRLLVEASPHLGLSGPYVLDILGRAQDSVDACGGGNA